MRTSTVHLEKALAEYNDKVDKLDREEPSMELLDALINRGTVLSMLDYTTSAKEDFDDAVDLIRTFEKQGIHVDPGYYVRAYVSRAELYSEDEGDSALRDYGQAAEHLNDLRPDSKYYNKKSIADMCSVAIHSLGDMDELDTARPFIDKGLEITSDEDSDYFKNIRLDLLNYSGYAFTLEGNDKAASETFASASELAAELHGRSELDNPEDLVFAFASKADADKKLKGVDTYLSEMENLLSIIDCMVNEGASIDDDIISLLHGDIAKEYMGKGEIALAEKHLMRKMSLELVGSDQYMKENGPR